jgi:hypothetical protein
VQQRVGDMLVGKRASFKLLMGGVGFAGPKSLFAHSVDLIQSFNRRTRGRQVRCSLQYVGGRVFKRLSRISAAFRDAVFMMW